MIEFKTGNILQANTVALVNTVNCEGYMGKGIAYQFKLQFPANNEAYVKACRTGVLKVGTVLPYKEDNKIIINFPTKDKWRENSKYEYIENGLKSLTTIISNWNIESIAIPPLGCGNGGLKWPIVKNLLLSELQSLDDKLKIVIYEPSDKINQTARVKSQPKLNTSHLLLMRLKLNLERFSKLRLQKTAYLINYLSNQDYFKFDAHHFGPYAHSLEILSKDIKEYQEYFGFDTDKAYDHAKDVLISDNIINKEKTYIPYLNAASDIVNKINNDKQLELLTTLLFIIEKGNQLSSEAIIEKLKQWSDYKAETFPENVIVNGLKELRKLELVQEEFFGYSAIKRIPNQISSNQAG